MSWSEAAVTFSTVEEAEEDVRSSGWDVDYRQIARGDFSCERTFLDGGDISLTSVNFKSKLQIVAEGSPGKCVGFFLPRTASAEVKLLGTTLNDGGLICFPGGSEMDIVISQGVGNETILVCQDKFHAIARALAPLETLSLPETTAICLADPLRCVPARWEILSMLQMGCLDAEAVSRLLAMFLFWITGTSPESAVEPLRHDRAVVIARRAQAFIEDNFQHKIRMEDICAHTGVGVRTLQRYFAAYFQVGVFEYIRTRRLNAARRALVVADPTVDSITHIASVNGFSHLGRFSVDYRAQFGESPKKTLAARKRTLAVRR